MACLVFQVDTLGVSGGHAWFFRRTRLVFQADTLGVSGGPTAPIQEGATGTAGVGGGTGPVTELPTTDQPQAGTSGPYTTPG